MIVVGTTLAAYVMDQENTWAGWLYQAEQLRSSWPDGVEFFAAVEVDGRGLEPFKPLLDRLAQVDGHHWSFSLNDGRTEVTTANRLRHITCGQNLVADYATSVGASHLLFLAADCAPAPDAIPKLVEVRYPIVGGHVSTYCLNGPRVQHHPACWDAHPTDGPGWHCDWPDMDVRAHMPTAAFVLLEREFFKQVKWRWDLDRGLSDDPAMYFDAEHLFGFNPPAVVRHDVVGQHYPDCIPAIEHRGHDRSVIW